MIETILFNPYKSLPACIKQIMQMTDSKGIVAISAANRAWTMEINVHKGAIH